LYQRDREFFYVCDKRYAGAIDPAKTHPAPSRVRRGQGAKKNELKNSRRRIIGSKIDGNYLMCMAVIICRKESIKYESPEDPN